MTTDTDQEKARALIHAVLPPETVNYAVLCWIIDRVSAGFAAGRAEERKRCAKVADAQMKRDDKRADELKAEGMQSAADEYIARAAVAEIIADTIRKGA